MGWIGMFLVVTVTLVIRAWKRKNKPGRPYDYCSCCGRSIPKGHTICAVCERDYEDRVMGYYL